jgi:Ni,Fe-hydrogenase maturation factor
MIPLYMVAELVREKTGAKIILLGIQPKNLNLGEGISWEIRESVEEIAAIIIAAISRVEKG